MSSPGSPWPGGRQFGSGYQMDGSLPHQRHPGWYQKCLFSGIAMPMGAGIVGHQQEATLLNEMGHFHCLPSCVLRQICQIASNGQRIVLCFAAFLRLSSPLPGPRHWAATRQKRPFRGVPTSFIIFAIAGMDRSITDSQMLRSFCTAIAFWPPMPDASRAAV